MIRTQLLLDDGSVSTAGEELIDIWRRSEGSFIRLDFEGEFTEQLADLLAQFGCSEPAIRTTTRRLHPPKLEVFEENTFVLFRGIACLDDELNLHPQQLAMFIGHNFLLTLHRGISLSINHFWERGCKSGLIRKPGKLSLHILEFASAR